MWAGDVPTTTREAEDVVFLVLATPVRGGDETGGGDGVRTCEWRHMDFTGEEVEACGGDTTQWSRTPGASSVGKQRDIVYVADGYNEAKNVLCSSYAYDIAADA